MRSSTGRGRVQIVNSNRVNLCESCDINNSSLAPQKSRELNTSEIFSSFRPKICLHELVLKTVSF